MFDLQQYAEPVALELEVIHRDQVAHDLGDLSEVYFKGDSLDEVLAYCKETLWEEFMDEVFPVVEMPRHADYRAVALEAEWAGFLERKRMQQQHRFDVIVKDRRQILEISEPSHLNNAA